MKTITISGTFTESVNNLVIIDLFSLNSQNNSYDVRKIFENDFVFTVNDLMPNSKYVLDVTGFTFGKFKINVTGDIPEVIEESFKKTKFSPGYTITTTS